MIRSNILCTTSHHIASHRIAPHRTAPHQSVITSHHHISIRTEHRSSSVREAEAGQDRSERHTTFNIFDRVLSGKSSVKTTSFSVCVHTYLSVLPPFPFGAGGAGASLSFVESSLAVAAFGLVAGAGAGLTGSVAAAAEAADAAEAAEVDSIGFGGFAAADDLAVSVSFFAVET